MAEDRMEVAHGLVLEDGRGVDLDPGVEVEVRFPPAHTEHEDDLVDAAPGKRSESRERPIEARVREWRQPPHHPLRPGQDGEGRCQPARPEATRCLARPVHPGLPTEDLQDVVETAMLERPGKP
jgi:hypothetical protein